MAEEFLKTLQQMKWSMARLVFVFSEKSVDSCLSIALTENLSRTQTVGSIHNRRIESPVREVNEKNQGQLVA